MAGERYRAARTDPMGADMAKQRPAWVRDVLVLAGFTLLNLVVIMPCTVVLYLCLPPVGGGRLLDVWLWLFGTPACIARELGWHDVAAKLFWFNPLFNGLVWWVVKLLRSKPAE